MSKVAVTTGPSRGIEREITRRLAADGFSVVIKFEANVLKEDEVVGETVKAGGRAIAVQAPYSRDITVSAQFCEVLSSLSGVDLA